MEQVWQFALAAAGSGGLVHLLDRWLLRHKRDLDVAALAQQVAEVALEKARQEQDAAYAEAARWRAEAAQLRQEQARVMEETARVRVALVAARAEIGRLLGLLRQVRPDLALSTEEVKSE